MKATKTGIYKKWKERSHNKIALKGTDNEGDWSTSFAGIISNLLLSFIF